MKVQYPITFACLRLLASLPMPLLRAAGWCLGSLVYVLNPSRRRTTRANLRIAFPAMDRRGIRQLSKAHLRNLGMALADRVWLWFAPLERVYSRLSFEGLEHMPQAVLSENETLNLAGVRPCILLVPHFAGLDAAWPAWVAARAHAGQSAPTLTTIFQPQSTAWEDALFRYGRGRFAPISQFTRHEGIRPVMKALKAGSAYYCLPDNDFGGKDAVFAPFFGVPAATLTVLPRLSAAVNAKVVPVISKMTRQGYSIQALPAWDHLQGVDIETYCVQMNAAIEHWVRQMPEQYLFSHRRYKTRPEGAPSIY